MQSGGLRLFCRMGRLEFNVLQCFTKFYHNSFGWTPSLDPYFSSVCYCAHRSMIPKMNFDHRSAQVRTMDGVQRVCRSDGRPVVIGLDPSPVSILSNPEMPCCTRGPPSEQYGEAENVLV
jgi:hypothetical protein